MSRHEILQTAKSFRKSGKFLESLKMLQPLFKEGEKFTEPPTDEETLEYSMCLSKIGASAEAERRLLSLSSSVSYLRDFYLALNYISIWDYQTALEYLEDLIEDYESELNEVQLGVCRLNLASCYAFLDQFDLAQNTANEAMCAFNQPENVGLKGRTLELLGSIHVYLSKFSKAKEILGQAIDCFKPDDIGNLYAHKWLHYIQLKDQKQREVAKYQLSQLMLKVPGEALFEFRRDIYYNIAKEDRNFEHLQKIYCGTPFESFRARMLKENEGFASATEALIFINDPLNSNHNVEVFNIYENSEAKKYKKIQEGLIHDLLVQVSQDFFKPVYYSALYEEIYEGESFDSENCNQKLERLLSRTRKELKDLGVPLNVIIEKGFVKLESTKPLLFFKPTYVERRSQLGVLLRRIESQFGWDFTASEARESLGFSAGKMHALLKLAEEKKLIKSTGVGRGQRYKMTIARSSV